MKNRYHWEKVEKGRIKNKEGWDQKRGGSIVHNSILAFVKKKKKVTFSALSAETTLYWWF